MLKALVIDDEDMTRDVLLNFLPWSEIGVSTVREASNGLIALDLALDYKPDIVLCDVKMPKMDGIEFSTQLSEALPDCKIIFLSAYSDKEYLKAAIRLKAISYIEKPLNLDEIVEVLKLAVAESLEVKNKRLQNQQFMLQNLCQSLTTRLADMNNVMHFVKDLNIDFPENSLYLSCIIRIYSSENKSSEECTRSVFTLFNAMLESHKDHFISMISGEGYILCYFKTDDCFDVDALQNKLHEFILKFNEPHPNLEPICKVCIALGYTVLGLQSVYKSYHSAVAALQKNFFYGYNKVISYSPDTTSPYELNESALINFSEHLRLHRKHEAVLTIKRLVSSIRNHTNTEPDSIREIFHKLLLIISKFAEHMNIRLPKDSSEFKINKIASTITLNELEENTFHMLDNVFSHLESKHLDQDMVAKITTIANENYQDHALSIQFISKKVYLTPNYVSALFKSSTGRTLTQYITDIRIEKAMELLKHTDLKLYTIGKMVGYVDGKYFTKVFEKANGITPKEYRGLQNEN
jgi:two-component system response regulator YesN